MARVDLKKISFYEKVGRELQRRRVEKNMTLTELSKLTETSNTVLHRIENGETYAPLHFLVLAAKVFGCSVNDFVPAV